MKKVNCDRQTDRQTDRKTDRQTEKSETDRKTEKGRGLRARRAFGKDKYGRREDAKIREKKRR